MSQELAGCARCPIQTRDRLCQKEDGKAPPVCSTQNYQHDSLFLKYADAPLYGSGG